MDQFRNLQFQWASKRQWANIKAMEEKQNKKSFGIIIDTMVCERKWPATFTLSPLSYTYIRTVVKSYTYVDELYEKNWRSKYSALARLPTYSMPLFTCTSPPAVPFDDDKGFLVFFPLVRSPVLSSLLFCWFIFSIHSPLTTQLLLLVDKSLPRTRTRKPQWKEGRNENNTKLHRLHASGDGLRLWLMISC